jgi:uncharacterized protein YceH (UPF0502 family)
LQACAGAKALPFYERSAEAHTIGALGRQKKSGARTGNIGDIVNIILTENEVRVLGSLIEKDITTPDYYPLSLNALTNACNQKSNRDPVMSLDEQAVRSAIDGLQNKRLAGPTSSADSRVPKFEHRLQEALNLTRGETAILCVLLLRGPQTPGELRGRTERMFRFEELSDVQATLQKMIERDAPLVKPLPRQPGTKEIRYTHLLAGDVSGWEAAPASLPSPTASADGDRLAQLENEVADLRREVSELRQVVDNFRKQFE